jgi:hypothetical protein
MSWGPATGQSEHCLGTPGYFPSFLLFAPKLRTFMTMIETAPDYLPS